MDGCMPVTGAAAGRWKYMWHTSAFLLYSRRRFQNRSAFINRSEHRHMPKVQSRLPAQISKFLYRGPLMKTIVAIAVAAALSAGVAHASINPPGTGQGELIEWVLDTTNNDVYARGIQVDETSILPSSAILSSATYNSSASPPVSTGTSLPTITPDANLTAFLAQDGGTDSFSFGILGAGKATGGATGNNPGASVVEFTSPQSIALSNLNVPSASGVQNTVADVVTTVTTLNGVLPAASGSSGNVSTVFNASTSSEFDLYANSITAVTPLGTDVNLYAVTGNGTKAGTGQLYTAGLVTMTASGMLEEVGPVPLPAAVWLLGSGLLGLVGVGRRRSA
jgi:hypothetical protein